MLIKLMATVSSVVASVALSALLPPQTRPPGAPPPQPKAKGKGEGKKKAEREPGGDLRKAYTLLRRLRASDGMAGRTDERLREWTDQAVKLYRNALGAQTRGDALVAREYGAAAHDLARAVDHARNAAQYDRPDPDLPAPSDDIEVDETRERAQRDLRRAYERITWLGTWEPTAPLAVYVKAAQDLYNAARRDLAAGRDERGGELARASEAMTHVPEHLAQAGTRDQFAPRPAPVPPPETSAPKGKRAERRDLEKSGLPPILPPG